VVGPTHEWQLSLFQRDIKSRAKAEKAEIYWGDETGMRNDCQHERSYALKGKTPMIRLNANRTSHIDQYDFGYFQSGGSSIQGFRWHHDHKYYD